MPAPTVRQCIAFAAVAGALAALAACAPWPMAGPLSAADSGGASLTIDLARAQAGGLTRGDAPGFPVTISAPGHYRLQADLVVPANQAAIVIAAAGVTLDLNGFTIRALPTCAAQDTACHTLPSASAHGIHVRQQGTQAVVRNGNVRGFAGTGVVVDTEARVEYLEISDNAASGLHANTSATHAVQIHRVAALRNGIDGFWLQTGRVTQSRAEGNGRHGFALGALMHWDECIARGNRDVDGDVLPGTFAASAIAGADEAPRHTTRQRTARGWLARITAPSGFKAG
jgi:hypothetical protein